MWIVNETQTIPSITELTGRMLLKLAVSQGMKEMRSRFKGLNITAAQIFAAGTSKMKRTLTSIGCSSFTALLNRNMNHESGIHPGI